MGMGVRLGIVVDDFKELPGISARPRDEVPKSIHFDVLGTPFGYIKRCRGSLWGPLASLLAPWGVLGTTLGHLWGPLDSLLTPWGGPWDHPGAPLDLDLSKRAKTTLLDLMLGSFCEQFFHFFDEESIRIDSMKNHEQKQRNNMKACVPQEGRTCNPATPAQSKHSF